MKKYLLLYLLIPSTLALAGNDNWHLGARSAGMAHASITLSDVWSTHHNQGGLGWLKSPNAGVYFENRFGLKELSHLGAAIAIPVGNGCFGINYSSFGWSLYKESKVGFAYAMKFNEKIAGGIQANYHSLRLGGNYGSTMAFSIESGIQAKVTDNLTIGVHVYNPTKTKLNDYNDERIPSIMRFGMSYQFSDKVLVTSEVEKDLEHKAVFRSGLEYIPGKMLYLRGGIATNPGIIAFGFGLNFDSFKADISSTYHQILGFSPQLSLTYVLGKQ
ncbi:hypothetical protein N9M27_01440 [Flavobacteriales bacterium]|nr:hypothetical protein [Flavobacteriales bacterium]